MGKMKILILKVFLFTTFIILNFFSNAQLVFERLTLSDAINKAASSGKIVFAQFVSSKCVRCNEEVDNSLKSAEVAMAVQRKCIPLKIDLDYKDRQKFIKAYNSSEHFGVFFIAPSGDLLHVFSVISDYHFANEDTARKLFIQQIEVAYSMLTEGRSMLTELDKEWNDYPKNIVAMEINLERRHTLGYPTDSLLEVYVKQLPLDSLTSIRVLKFIFLKAPSLFSNTFKVMLRDTSLFLKAFYEISVNDRINTNASISDKSLKKAIIDKDTSKLFKLCNYAQGSQVDRKNKYKVCMSLYINYNKAVGDTAKALLLTQNYLDYFCMTVSIDSIKKIDAAYRKLIHDSLIHQISDSAELSYYKSPEISFSILSQLFATDLNEGAWYIYITTTNPFYLQKAKGYAEKSLKFYESPDATDTYARLAYKTGSAYEAIKFEERAIELYKQRNFNTKEFEEALGKMKNGKELNDK